MIKGLHHVQITIPKETEEKAKNFYCGILGLQEIEKPESLKGRGGFWLKVGDKDVHIGTEDDFDRLKTKAHIAYEVEDISYWKNRLTKENIQILDGVPIPNFERFEFRDPFGNRVEMIQNLNL
ncbi:VOC family protein [Peribacillus castrilensis]|jgi:catechol 2,3-dioxygenase-like lactoylglutathione lyase family enzyme|uniref:Glyoxalase/bleomycin resistance protein/dioxygenase n=1 Tax=Peribacillus simplex TaxID=1478 RepID=A0AAN2TSS2_9BACI|nr:MULTISPECIES: VOC family protein [Bacillaceae]KRF52410.1 glyoxalase [Bacillus sp. Soil745]MCP1096660.1 VOC family protein [Bacillaceae bacterium OS4b]QNK48965.1 VOC family protein [Brevibacterium sp. PAMC23299]AMM92565.1 glyoxalase [Peribacillus simplex]MBD8591794.1 VOC family protein [Peribacillus simplex]